MIQYKYPIVACYGVPKEETPIYIDNRPNSVDSVPEVVNALARYQVAIMQAEPLTFWPSALAEMKKINSNQLQIAYAMASSIWPVNSPDDTYWKAFRQLVEADPHGILYDMQGNEWGLTNVNLASRIITYKLAYLWYNRLVRTGLWKGIFWDTFGQEVYWIPNVDYARAGFRTRLEFDDAWRGQCATLANQMRMMCPQDFILMGNGGWTGAYCYNGWMHENFPFQNGGGWDKNMIHDPGGFITDELRYHYPQLSVIFTAANMNQDWKSNENQRKLRFGLASSCLGKMCHVFAPADCTGRWFIDWWADEYAVDLQTGMSSEKIMHMGWLGRKVILGKQESGLWICRFENGMVAVNPTQFPIQHMVFGYKKIKGTVNSTNDGKDVINFIINAQDAVFLIKK